MEQAPMIRANLAGVVLFLAVTACAGAATQVQAPQARQEAKKDAKPVAANEKNIVCHMERPTGSNIPERVCRYVNLDANENTQRTQDMLRSDQRGGPGPLNP
jgi:hypothetical protein